MDYIIRTCIYDEHILIERGGIDTKCFLLEERLKNVSGKRRAKRV